MHTIVRGRDRAGEPLVIDQTHLRDHVKGDAERIAVGLFGAVAGVLGLARDEGGGRSLEPEMGHGLMPLQVKPHRWYFERGFEREY